jgi:curved DNA-binding protein CbpA
VWGKFQRLVDERSSPSFMTDYFALLKEQRRPWIDPDSLKEKFLALSAEVHPDRVHGAEESQKRAAQQCYAELNAAYNCLREPKERLAHLLELETGATPKQVQNVPSDLMDAFMEITNVCRGADAFLAEKNATASPLLKLQLFERGQELTEKLMKLQGKINLWREELFRRLKEIDGEWARNRDPGSAERQKLLEALEGHCQLLGYFGRWSAQIQERIVQISF